VYRFTLVLPAVFLVALALSAQPASTSTPQMAVRRFLQDASRLITAVEATPSRCYSGS
jgi:hypothetical protein